MKKSATLRPAIVETAYNSFRQKTCTINFCIELKEDGTFEYESVEIAPGCFDYGHIVSAIIRERYSDDEMAAVVNNYLISRLDSESEQVAEFNQMQAWREYAKGIAKEALAAEQ